MDQLMKILSEIRPDIDFETETRLIDDQILDSLDIVTLVGELNYVFGVEIGVDKLMPEHFNSAEAMWALVRAELGE